MKKCFILVSVVLFMLLSACDNIESNEKINSMEGMSYDQSSTSESENSCIDYLSPSLYTNLIEEKENYRIYTDDAYTGYFYIIIDNDGQMLDEGYCGWKFDSIRYVDENIVEISYGGISGPLFNAKYFDVDRDRVSRVYEMPLATSENLIVYFKYCEDNSVRLVIQDIFNSQKFYTEFEDARFSASVFIKMGTAVFTESDSVKVTFVTQDGVDITETYSWGNRTQRDGSYVLTED